MAALDGVKGLRILPFREGECRSNHWFFSLYLKDSGLDRDTVIEKLQAQHIQTRPVWALIHEQADYPRNEAYGLDKALDYRKYIVNLPCSTNLSFEDCDRVIEAVLGAVKRLPPRGCARRRVSECNRRRRHLARRLKLSAKRTDEGKVRAATHFRAAETHSPLNPALARHLPPSREGFNKRSKGDHP